MRHRVFTTLLLLTSVTSVLATNEPHVCFEKHCFSVEIADTPALRSKGLMYRSYLPKKRGMLFTYNKPSYTAIWMKNTQISLDVIWMTPDWRINHIEKNTTPFSSTILKPKAHAQYILEINAGWVNKLALKLGDQAVFIQQTQQKMSELSPRTLPAK